MSVFIFRLLLVLLVLISSNTYSQDKIYFDDKAVQCKVLDITSTTVTYLLFERKATPTNVYINKVVLLFNEKGVFLQPSRLDFNQQASRQLVTGFLNPDTTALKIDKIYMLDNRLIQADITKEDKNIIYTSKDNLTTQIPKKQVAAVIYKNGTHTVYGSFAKAADVLWTTFLSTPKSSQGSEIAKNANEIDSLVKIEGMADKNIKQENKSGGTKNTVVESTNIPEPQRPDTLAKNNSTANNLKELPSEIRKDTTPSIKTTEPSSFLTDELLKGNVTKKEFEEKATQKTKQLSSFVKIICDKSVENEEINRAINQAVLLFVNEDARVEVSSINKTDVKIYKIKEYLSHIKLIQYDKIEIEWTNVQYVSDLKLNPDGNYSGIVTFEQVFKGYRDGKLIYSDITRKNVVVILKAYKKTVEGNVINLWEVLLSDIGVVSTKAV